MEILVTFGNNLNRGTDAVSNAMTIRQFLDSHNMDLTRGSINLDGTTLAAGDWDKSFADFGINSKCYLLQVVKADNA